MRRSGRIGLMVLAVGLVATGTTLTTAARADDHRGNNERAEHAEHDRGRVDRDEHHEGDRDDRGRYAGRGWYGGDEHREHHGGGWGVRAFPFGWGGGPIGIPLPRPVVPVPGYGGTPYNGPYTPLGPDYDNGYGGYGGYGYGQQVDPYGPRPGYGW